MSSLSVQQEAAWKLLRADMQFLYTITVNQDLVGGTYWNALMPYMAMIIDGAEEWILAVNRVHPHTIVAPVFTEEQTAFYERTRSGIKLWEFPLEQIKQMMADKYRASDQYFSACCLPLAKLLKLYDIYGVYCVEDHFCNNTVLDMLYLPDYHLDDEEYGPYLQSMAYIAGQYAVVFDALLSYHVNDSFEFAHLDFGGFVKSPVGNDFSEKFILLSLLCQINFVLICVDGFIVEEVPIKLRIAYVLYYYLCGALPEIRQYVNYPISLNTAYCSREFRNAMAHYKIGRYLREDEIIFSDLMCGMTYKAFGVNYQATKDAIYTELRQLARQLEDYLHVRPEDVRSQFGNLKFR